MKFSSSFLLFVSLVLFAAPSEAQDCPISGIATTDFGTGGFGIDMQLAWEPAACSISVSVVGFACCNTFQIGHAVIVGDAALPNPVPLPFPFRSDSLLLVQPNSVLGVFPGSESNQTIPPNPALAGQTFYTQGVAVFFTTIGLSIDAGTSQGVEVQFLP